MSRPTPEELALIRVRDSEYIAELPRFADVCVRDRRALLAEIEALQPAADCWNALAQCYRITCMGSAGLIERFTATGYAHITVNLWTCREDPTKGVRDEQDTHGRERFGEFMKIALANGKMQS